MVQLSRYSHFRGFPKSEKQLLAQAVFCIFRENSHVWRYCMRNLFVVVPRYIVSGKDEDDVPAAEKHGASGKENEEGKNFAALLNWPTDLYWPAFPRRECKEVAGGKAGTRDSIAWQKAAGDAHKNVLGQRFHLDLSSQLPMPWSNIRNAVGIPGISFLCARSMTIVRRCCRFSEKKVLRRPQDGQKRLKRFPPQFFPELKLWWLTDTEDWYRKRIGEDGSSSAATFISLPGFNQGDPNGKPRGTMQKECACMTWSSACSLIQMKILFLRHSMNSKKSAGQIVLRRFAECCRGSWSIMKISERTFAILNSICRPQTIQRKLWSGLCRKWQEELGDFKN